MALTGRAKIFRHGGSQAVRIPRAFHLAGTEAEISRSPAGGIVLDPLEAGYESRQRRFMALAGACPHLLHAAPAPRLRKTEPHIAWLPDVNTVMLFLLGKSPKLGERLAQAFGQLYLSAIVLAECEFQASRATDAFTRLKLRELTQIVPVVPFTLSDAAHYGAIRHEFAAQGRSVAPLHAQLAAQAIRLGATLVTQNSPDFTSVNGLNIEEWAA